MGVVRIGKDEIPTTGGHAYGKLDYFERCADIRPREVQNFVDASDSGGGVTLSTDVSIFDWKDLATNAASGAVLQPVLLATRKSCNGQGNWYPQAGDHGYRFSLTSHAGDWRMGWRVGVAANHPFEVVSDAQKANSASLPMERSFLGLSATDATVCAVKKAEDDDSVIVRLTEMEGRDSRVSLSALLPVCAARRTSIIEDDQSAADVRNGELETPLGHHAVETFRLRFASPK
jgi:alpha-mannosidase